MHAFVTFIRELNIYTVLIRLLLSFFIGAFIGAERGKQGRAAGMRTHILVCVASTLASMIGVYGVDILGYSSDPMRIAAQVVSGIGFLGVGTILVKGGTQITGLTTAAGLWAVSAVGLALGIGFYEGALIATVLFIFTVMVLQKIENRLYSKPSQDFIYIEISSDAAVSEMLALLRNSYLATELNVTPPRSGKAGNVGIEGIVPIEKLKITMESFANIIQKEDSVIYVLE